MQQNKRELAVLKKRRSALTIMNEESGDPIFDALSASGIRRYTKTVALILRGDRMQICRWVGCDGDHLKPEPIYKDSTDYEQLRYLGGMATLILVMLSFTFFPILVLPMIFSLSVVYGILGRKIMPLLLHKTSLRKRVQELSAGDPEERKLNILAGRCAAIRARYASEIARLTDSIEELELRLADAQKIERRLVAIAMDHAGTEAGLDAQMQLSMRERNVPELALLLQSTREQLASIEDPIQEQMSRIAALREEWLRMQANVSANTLRPAPGSLPDLAELETSVQLVDEALTDMVDGIVERRLNADPERPIDQTLDDIERIHDRTSSKRIT